MPPAGTSGIFLTAMPKSIQDWLAEGEHLYTNALSELAELEQQLADLQGRMLAKQADVNKLASVIGKPPVGTPPPAPTPAASAAPATNGNGHPVHTGQVVGHPAGDHASVLNTPATIARALTGKGLGGR